MTDTAQSYRGPAHDGSGTTPARSPLAAIIPGLL
jgi:hypothetical protein